MAGHGQARRQVDAAEWQYGKAVAAQADPAAAAMVTIPVLKDDVTFGVRTVDGAGHGSVGTKVEAPPTAGTGAKHPWESASGKAAAGA